MLRMYGSLNYEHDDMVMAKKKVGAVVAKKAKKSELAVREPQPSWIEEFDKLSEPFRLMPWDPFRGFEWPVEYELPTRDTLRRCHRLWQGVCRKSGASRDKEGKCGD